MAHTRAVGKRSMSRGYQILFKISRLLLLRVVVYIRCVASRCLVPQAILVTTPRAMSPFSVSHVVHGMAKSV